MVVIREFVQERGETSGREKVVLTRIIIEMLQLTGKMLEVLAAENDRGSWTITGRWLVVPPLARLLALFRG
jgi:hypothetical protein